MKGLIRTKYTCEKKGKKTWEDILMAIFSNENYNESTIFEIKNRFLNKSGRLNIGYGDLKKMIPSIEHITSTLDYKTNKKPIIVQCLSDHEVVDSIASKYINKI